MDVLVCAGRSQLRCCGATGSAEQPSCGRWVLQSQRTFFLPSAAAVTQQLVNARHWQPSCLLGLMSDIMFDVKHPVHTVRVPQASCHACMSLTSHIECVMPCTACADIFFRTTDCLRADQSSCYRPGDPYYDITHSGLDAQINRYIDETLMFASLPDSLTYACSPDCSCAFVGSI